MVTAGAFGLESRYPFLDKAVVQVREHRLLLGLRRELEVIQQTHDVDGLGVPDFKVAQLPRFQQQDHAEFIVNRNRKGEKKSTPEYLRKRGYKDMFSPLKLRGRTNSYFNINAERCRASFKGIDAEGRRNPGATRAPHHSYSVGTDNTNDSESKTKQARQRLLWDIVDTPQDGLQGSDDQRMVGAAPTVSQAKDSDQDRHKSTLSGAPLFKEGAHECDLLRGCSVKTSSAVGTSRQGSTGPLLLSTPCHQPVLQ